MDLAHGDILGHFAGEEPTIDEAMSGNLSGIAAFILGRTNPDVRTSATRQ
jgi:hypothetical protein